MIQIGDATLYTGDVLGVLATLPDQSVQTCVTSPPYFGLRDYGMEGQIGLEPTIEDFVGKMVEVFREVKRVLRDDGTLWLNLGDSYNAQGAGNKTPSGFSQTRPSRISGNGDQETVKTGRGLVAGLKPKDLIGIPWRVAFALQADGWYLRQDIIWHKPNPMPESVKDRCTKAHEYIFMMAKSERYYYDQEAIMEPASHETTKMLDGWDTGPGGHGSYHKQGREKGRKTDKQRGHGRRHAGFNDRWDQMTKEEQCSGMRNKRDVWSVSTKPFPGAHFATFPPELIRPCILAGAPAEGVVMDPFSGSGTTGMVALEEGRQYVGIELNPEYQALAVERITPAAKQSRLFA